MLDRLFRALTIVGAVEILGLIINMIAHPSAAGPAGQDYAIRLLVGLVIGPGMLLVATFVIWRVPGNLVGRFLLLLGLGIVAFQYDYHLASPQLSALTLEAAFIYVAGIGLPSLIYLMLCFPSGKVYPPSLARPAKVYAIVKPVGVLVEIIASSRAVGIVALPANPLYYAPLAAFRPLISATVGVVGLMVPAGLIAGVVSIGLRYRASNASERQQIKWVAWAFGLMALIVLTFMALVLSSQGDSTLVNVGLAFVAAALLNLVASIGIAIWRHRLFDIDIIIHRTLVYGGLTAALALVYFSGVVVLQTLLPALTGLASQSQFAVVASTLAIAALFAPARSRLQDFIDRRFYRRKYDAAKTLAEFSAVARDETDLEKLSRRLVAVVSEAMQPASVSLWLRQREAAQGKR